MALRTLMFSVLIKLCLNSFDYMDLVLKTECGVAFTCSSCCDIKPWSSNGSSKPSLKIYITVLLQLQSVLLESSLRKSNQS